MEKRVYYPRATAADWAQLLHLGFLLGELVVDSEGGFSGPGWVYIGMLSKETGATLTDPETGEEYPERIIVKDANGAPYLHANLYTFTDLRAKAEALAAQQPEIAEALQQLHKYFPHDEDGNPVQPSNPQVKRAGMET